jgi:hypothetical protein
MQKLKVIKKFNLFEFDNKKRSTKLVTYEVGDIVNPSMRTRLADKANLFLNVE